jgi:predicted DNA-binding WGR domain protein
MPPNGNIYQGVAAQVVLVDPSVNSAKFWRYYAIPSLKMLITHWGRIGSKGQFKVQLTTDSLSEGAAAIRQKINSGYYYENQGDDRVAFDLTSVEVGKVAAKNFEPLGKVRFGRVDVTGMPSPAERVGKREIDEFKANLLAMQERLAKTKQTLTPNETATPEPEPAVPAADSMAAKLAEALRKAAAT